MKSAFLLLPILLIVSCKDSGSNAGEERVSAVHTPVFTRDIAPIIFKNCASCHRPGQSAPFSLLTYRDVSRRAEDILTVTHSGYMPPWLPVSGDADFEGERTLTDAELATLKAWVDQGKVEGEASLLPELPKWSEGWMMESEPDLVLTLAESFNLPAEGEDVFRNFVFPVEITQTRYVRAVEFRPGNPSVVHHAWMTVEKGDSCRRLDQAHPEAPGFPGMSMGYSAPPDGHALGWTPGKLPNQSPPKMAWKFEPGTDLVLQLHLIPSGKAETIAPKIGLYFTDEAPTLHPYGFQLSASEIDIPAGDADYLVERHFTLPVNASLLSLYPHAHYLGKTIQLHATLPGGRRQTILDIPDWDFNWQDLYTLNTPFDLPAGTQLHMKFRYDNSADNPRNPNLPPKRVRYGDRSSDEMGNLWLQLLAKNPQDRARLEEAALQNTVQATPNFRDHYALGNLYQGQGRHEKAVTQYRLALALHPNHPLLHHNLAGSLAASNQLEAAIAAMKESIRLDPNYANSHLNLGNFYAMKNEFRAAWEAYRDCLKIEPANEVARRNFGILNRQLSK